MFYNIFGSILNGIRTFASDAVNYLKCRSMCCNNINVYNPNLCCVQGSMSNRRNSRNCESNTSSMWSRASTPAAESPIRRDKTTYFTPKNK